MKHYLFLLFLITFQISFCQPKKASTIKVLWFDTLNDSLIFNKDYFNSIPDNEKAAIAYVALHDSRDCEWDGEVNQDYSNLNCKIIKALGLGYQCSQQHLQILNYWFRNDTSILNEVKFCPMTPNGAHQIHGIDNISLTRLLDNQFKIFYSASGANIRAMTLWSFTETILFKTETDKLIIITRKEGKVKKGEFKE